MTHSFFCPMHFKKWKLLFKKDGDVAAGAGIQGRSSFILCMLSLRFLVDIQMCQQAFRYMYSSGVNGTNV